MVENNKAFDITLRFLRILLRNQNRMSTRVRLPTLFQRFFSPRETTTLNPLQTDPQCIADCTRRQFIVVQSR